MRPFNIFSQSAILFLLGAILLLRSHSSNSTDKLLGSILIIFSIARLIEFTSIKAGEEETGRALATLMWLLPLAMMVCCLSENKRFDTLLIVVAVIVSLLYYFIRNATVFTDHFIVISPDRRAGDSNGLFEWKHTDEDDNAIPFLPFVFYMALTIGIIYTVSTFVTNYVFWILFSSIVISSVIGGIVISSLYGSLLSYFWSMFSISLIATGIIAILLFPG